MNLVLRYKKTLCLILFFCACFSTSFAQEVFISQNPENPREGDEVRLTLSSDKYDLTVANITWTVDGQEVDQGVGRKTLILRVSQNGLGQVVIANIEQTGFNPSQAQKVVAPNTNFIIYEGADSYVPPFYRGRRLPVKEGNTRAAIFSFKEGAIDNISGGGENFIWAVNGTERGDLSGQNKILNNILSKVTDNSLSIRVTKVDQGGDKKITDTNIPLQNTEVVIYKTDEKRLLKQVLSSTEIGKTVFLIVEPFFFTVPNKRSTALTYTWKINDIPTKTATPWAVFFTGKERDSVEINLNIFNNQKITQDGSRGFTFKVE